MTPKISALKTKLAVLLLAISGKVDTKLGRTEAAVSADKLTSPFTLSFTGDATASGDIQGNSSVAMGITLANTAVAPGVYSKVTVDSKGRVTAGALLLAADVPVLDAAKITSGVFAAARIPTLNQNTTGNAATASELQTSRAISMTGDASWTVPFKGDVDASGTLTLANTGVVAGTYGSETAIPQVVVDAKGRITSISTVAIKPGTVIPVKEYVDIAAGVTQSYDLEVLLGAAAADFDLSSAEIVVSVKDTNATSPTYNAYINPEAVATYGLLDERYVVIANQFDTTMNFHVKVLVHPNVV